MRLEVGCHVEYYRLTGRVYGVRRNRAGEPHSVYVSWFRGPGCHQAHKCVYGAEIPKLRVTKAAP